MVIVTVLEPVAVSGPEIMTAGNLGEIDEGALWLNRIGKGDFLKRSRASLPGVLRR